jgi:quinol monooxygenase YgiN
MRVAVVRFQIKPEAVAAFRDALLRHAATSPAREPGCLQFDFAADLTSPGALPHLRAVRG